MIQPEPTPQNPQPEPEKCKACKGKGQVRYEPANETRKMALQIGGLLDKGGGAKIVVNQNQANFHGDGGGTYDSLMEALDGALYGKGRDRLRRANPQTDDSAIDGEMVE